jgi:hypothetical protein
VSTDDRIYDMLDTLDERRRDDHKVVVDKLDLINGRVRKTEVQVARLEVKAGVAGAVSGLVAGLAAAFGMTLRG